MNSLKEKALPSLHGCKTEKLKEILEKRLEKNDNEQKDFHCATVNMSWEVITICGVCKCKP